VQPAALAYLVAVIGPGATATIRILESNPTYGLGEIANCLIADWRLQPNAQDFDRRNVALLDLAARFPGACAYIDMIEPTSKPPTAPVRKAAMDIFRALGPKLSCVATIVHGAELRVTFVRAVLSGMTFLVPQVQPFRVFKQTEAAARWIQPHLGADAELERRLVAAAESLRPQKHAAPAQRP
jgi:hypothetical protein